MRTRITALGLTVALLLGGCGSLASEVRPGQSLRLGAPGPVIDVTEDVHYYPACGNEKLSFEGKVYFPFIPGNPGDFPRIEADAAAGALSEAGPHGLSRGTAPGARLRMVVAPGPGDDVGTLTRYEGGFAYWISDSHDLSTWLTNTKLEYNWVC